MCGRTFYTFTDMMKRNSLVTAAILMRLSFATAAELPRDVAAIDYSKSKGLVAAAYQGGEVVVWDFTSGSVKHLFNAAGPGTTRNKPLAHFSPDGGRLAFTAEGEAGLTVYDLEAGSSMVVVPRRLLYRGITAFTWSHQQDAILVAIGRDIALVSAGGHILWQRRLETKSLITDVVWHPSEHFYNVATDDTVVSSYETVSGRVIATARMDATAQGADVKLSWNGDGSAIVAGVQGKTLALLDADSLKATKPIPCNCIDFAWSPAGKEIAATVPPGIAVFSASGQKAREIHTPFEGPSPILWSDDTHLLTAFSDAAIVLRDARGPKIIRTFALAAGAGH